MVESVAHAVGLGGESKGEEGEKKGQTSANVTDKALFADILSVLAMTYSDTGKRETLKYRLRGGSEEDPGVWGHEYVR
jgi:26S proteasome regulatory subunit N1